MWGEIKKLAEVQLVSILNYLLSRPTELRKFIEPSHQITINSILGIHEQRVYSKIR